MSHGGDDLPRVSTIEPLDIVRLSRLLLGLLTLHTSIARNLCLDSMLSFASLPLLFFAFAINETLLLPQSPRLLH